MKLQEYTFAGIKVGVVRRRKKFGDNTILLLSSDTSLIPPDEGQKNLISVDKNDTVLWVAELPTSFGDVYVEMKFVDPVIIAESSNSFVAEIDPISGKTIRKYMVK